VIGEAMVALVLADAVSEKFGGDSIGEALRNYETYRDQLLRFSAVPETKPVAQ
jgi:chorismate synthase